MSEFWRQCEGQVIDNRFRLRHYLGGTDDSAVFLTQLAEPQSKKAAIKFIPAGPNADLQISLWRRIMQLVHPNLLRIYEIGRCRIENRDRLYVVMEYAEEDLSQILPQRALTGSEAREMLEPVLDALVYLHSFGYVHSRIKPSNILATADQLKLSSDALFPIGESRKLSRKFDAHDAPETATSPLSAAADVWSLGMTLVETLTQRTCALQPGSQADPIVPDTLPQPFLDVARHALRRDPRRRWSVPEIAARLNPVAVAAAAGQSVSPLAVPLSTVRAVPAAKLQVPKFEAALQKAQAEAPRPPATNPPKQGLELPNYVVPVAAALLVIVAVLALPKILGHRSDSSSSAATAAVQTAARPDPVEKPARREAVPAPKPAAPTATQNSLKAAAEKKATPEPRSSVVPTPTPAAVRADTFPSANVPSHSGSSSAHAEVLEQVLPDASEKALATIHGVVRVGVRVQVDPTGNVAEATLDSPGPSKYFADLALKAARRWQFTSPEAGGHSVPSEWLIHFHFTPSGPKAIPTQTAP
ncbi:MAG TPA: TonB family protein [Candidatus Polarisedimenticolia bacterium]|nr:TonB family protein [Candidatus Polarisedimenticolia bacterium]